MSAYPSVTVCPNRSPISCLKPPRTSRFDPEIPFEERVGLWQANRAPLDAEFQEFGEARVRYNLFAFGARTIGNFSSKIYTLVQRPFSYDGGGWVMFDDESQKIVGFTLP